MALEQRDLRRKEPVSYFPDPVLASLINGAKQLSTMASSNVVSSGRRNSHNSSSASLSSNGSVKAESQDTSNGRGGGSSSSAGKTEELASVDTMRRNEPINRFKRKYAGQLLPVECNGQPAQLDVDNLPEIVGSMTHAKRKCVLFVHDWVTPTEYEALTGFGSRKNWRSSVRMQGRSIKQHIDALASESVAEDLENSCFSTPSSSSSSHHHHHPHQQQQQQQQQQYAHAIGSTTSARSTSSGGSNSSRSRHSSSVSPVKEQPQPQQQQQSASPARTSDPSASPSFSDNRHPQRHIQTVAMPSSSGGGSFQPSDPGPYEPPFKMPRPVARSSPPPPLSSRTPQRSAATGLSGASPSRRPRVAAAATSHASGGSGGYRSPADGAPWITGGGGSGHGKRSLESMSPPDLLPAHSVCHPPPPSSPSSSSSAGHVVRVRKPPSGGSNKRKASPPVRVDYGNGMSEPLLCENTTDSGMSITVTAVEDESEKRVLICAQPPLQRTSSVDAGTPRRDLVDGLLPLGHPFSWTCHQVGDFLRSKALYKAARKCEEEEIDGRAFLKLREDHFLNRFNMKLGPALNFVELVTQLNAYFLPTEIQRAA